MDCIIYDDFLNTIISEELKVNTNQFQTKTNVKNKIIICEDNNTNNTNNTNNNFNDNITDKVTNQISKIINSVNNINYKISYDNNIISNNTIYNYNINYADDKNFDYDNWNLYLNLYSSIISSDKKIVKKYDLFKYFGSSYKIKKNFIKKILLSKFNLDLLSKPFCTDNINKIICQLESVEDSKIKYNYADLILLYLYFANCKQIEQIHWSYFKLNHFFIFYDKINDVNKIIKIIQKNYMHNKNSIQILNNIIYNYLQSNVQKNIIVYDYINNLNCINYPSVKPIYDLTELPTKYKKITELLANKKNVLSNKINLNDKELISKLITNSNDLFFDKLIQKVDKDILINCVSKNLLNQNIKESQILKILNLFENKNTIVGLYDDNLFCVFLLNGYTYCIKKIWKNSLPKFKRQIANTIIQIIKQDNEKIFKALLDENILDYYLYGNQNGNQYGKYNFNLWACILFNCEKIPKILLDLNYQIPKKILLELIKKISSSKYKFNKYKYNNFKRIYFNKNIDNSKIFIKNFKLFDLPINDITLEILFVYLDNDSILEIITKYFEKLDIEIVIGLVLANKKFELLKKIFLINPQIMNKNIYCKNISKYYKYIRDDETLSQIYIHNISHYKQNITRSIANYSLKYKNYNLIKKIIVKNKKLFTIENIQKYFFGINFDVRWNFRFGNNSNSVKIFDMLKKNIDNWNDIYKNKKVCGLLIYNKNLSFDEILIIKEKNKDFNINFDEISTKNFNDQEKFKLIEMYVGYLTANNTHKYVEIEIIKTLFALLSNIKLEDFISLDTDNKLVQMIKNFLDFRKILDYVFDYCPDNNKIRYINYFGYLLPDYDFNTFAIVNYIGENPEVIEYYLSKNNFLKEKTYNYLHDYVEYLSCKCKLNSKNKLRKLFFTDKYNVYKKILLDIPSENIIRELEPKYKSSLVHQIGIENYKKIINIKQSVDWLYEHVIPNNSNDILSEL
jgi:hypothetical protein